MACWEPVPTLEPVLCISIANELAPSQENWFQRTSNTNKELLTSGEGNRDQAPSKTATEILKTIERHMRGIRDVSSICLFQLAYH